MGTRNTKRPEPEPDTQSSFEREGDVVNLTQTSVPPIAVCLDPGSQVEALDVAPNPKAQFQGKKTKFRQPHQAPRHRIQNPVKGLIGNST